MTGKQRSKKRLVLSLRWTGRAIGFLSGGFMGSVLLEEWGSMTPGAWDVVTLGVAVLIGVGLTFWRDWIGGLILLGLGIWQAVQGVLDPNEPAIAVLLFSLPLVIAGILLLAASFVARQRSDEGEATGTREGGPAHLRSK